MFVEGVRLFVVVLGTAAGFWAARTFGTEAQGLGGMLGCLLGYVGGGILGRVLDQAARRGRDAGSTAVRPPGSSPARSARSPAPRSPSCSCCRSRCSSRSRSRSRSSGSRSWIFGYVGFRIVARQSEAVLELLGLSTRPLVRAQAFDARDGLLVDSSVVMDGQLLAADAAPVCSAAT